MDRSAYHYNTIQYNTMLYSSPRVEGYTLALEHIHTYTKQLGLKTVDVDVASYGTAPANCLV